MKLTTQPRQGHHEFDLEPDTELWRINWRREGYPFCGIYVVAPDNNWPSKIGISQNPVNRLVALQTSSWRKLAIQKYGYAESFAAARQVEQKAHSILAEDGKAMIGEWFDIRPEQAFEIVEFAAQLEGVEIRTTAPNDEIRAALKKFCNDAAVTKIYENLS